MAKPTLKDLENSRRNSPRIPDEAIDPNDVMPSRCKTCPWGNPETAIALTAAQQAALAQMILSQANQRCHSPGLSGQAETKICRGARDVQLQFFHRLGVLSEPTDECWAKTLEQCRRL